MSHQNQRTVFAMLLVMILGATTNAIAQNTCQSYCYSISKDCMGSDGPPDKNICRADLAQCLNNCANPPPPVCPDPTAILGPPAPVSVTTTPSSTGAGQIAVTWPAVSGADAYHVTYELSSPTDVHNLGVPLGYVSGNRPVVVPASSTSVTQTDLPLFYSVDAIVSTIKNVNGPSGPIACEGAGTRSNNRVTPVATATAPVWGFADTHTHQFADRAFDQKTIIGKAFGDPTSAFAGDYVGHASELMLPTHHTGGYPNFDGWPTWNIQSHQQMYEDWLFRAYLGGLRLMVMLGMSNETLCVVLPSVPSTPPASCSDMDAVDRQLSGAREFESYLNNACADGDDPPRCPQRNMGWYHVVTSAEEARATINRGQLAVVLGVEVDRLFRCALTDQGDPRTYLSGDHVCTVDDVNQALDAYYARGLRHVFPAHLANTAFGGMALYGGPIVSFWNLNNRFLNGAWIQASTDACLDSHVTFDFNVSPYSLTSHLGDLLGIGIPPAYPGKGHCNQMGLTSPLGQALIVGLMRHHMIIDIDHMSERSVRDTFALVQPARYPVIAGHTGFMGVLEVGVKENGVLVGNRNENAKTDSQLEYVRSSGGLVAAGLNAGKAEGIIQYQPSYRNFVISNDCDHSTKTWAQAYLYAVDHLGGPDHAAVAVATDQPLNEWLGPRFDGGQGLSQGGPGLPSLATIQGCDGNENQVASYQLAQMGYDIGVLNPGMTVALHQGQTGNRFWDFNKDGMAHIGMYPDMIQDLITIGLTKADLQPLLRSAEGYIEMWERAEHNLDPRILSVLNGLVLGR